MIGERGYIEPGAYGMGAPSLSTYETACHEQETREHEPEAEGAELRAAPTAGEDGVDGEQQESEGARE
jgi:hypothetical protein